MRHVKSAAFISINFDRRAEISKNSIPSQSFDKCMYFAMEIASVGGGFLGGEFSRDGVGWFATF